MRAGQAGVSQLCKGPFGRTLKKRQGLGQAAFEHQVRFRQGLGQAHWSLRHGQGSLLGGGQTLKVWPSPIACRLEMGRGRPVQDGRQPGR